MTNLILLTAYKQPKRSNGCLLFAGRRETFSLLVKFNPLSVQNDTESQTER